MRTTSEVPVTRAVGVWAAFYGEPVLHLWVHSTGGDELGMMCGRWFERRDMRASTGGVDRRCEGCEAAQVERALEGER